MTIRCRTAVSALAAFLAVALCCPGFAQEDKPEKKLADKPAISFDTKAIEVNVTIEAALEAYPGLYDNLLREGRKEAEKWRDEAEKDRKERPDFFQPDRRYWFERSYSRRSAIQNYVSVLRSDSTYGGGAHPNTAFDTILWDATAKKRISIRPFFKETADNGPTLQALAKAIRAALVVEKKARDIPVKNPETDFGLDSVKPSLLKIGAVALAPSTIADKSSGLIVYFSPYAVGAYVEGSYTVFIPAAKFEPYLSPEGARLFGGERPPGDADQDN